MTKKTLIIAAIVSAGLIPLSSFAWHGAPCWDDHPGPGWHHRYDAAPCDYYPDRPRIGPHHKAAFRAPMNRGVHTFHMNREEATDFINEVGSVLGVSAQQKAWQQMQKAYGDLAQVRFERRDAFEPGMPRQARLEARSAFMNEHAKAFDAYVKARGELQKVLGDEKMAEFDHIVDTGSLLKPPAPAVKPQPRAPKAPAPKA